MNFCSAQDVREHFKNLDTTHVTEDAIKLNSMQAIKNRLAELEDLKIDLMASEENFFRSMGLPTSNMKVALQELQLKIDQWNYSGAQYILNVDINSLILEIGDLFSVDLEKLKEVFMDETVRDEIFKDFLVKDNIDEIDNIAVQLVKEGLDRLKDAKVISSSFKPVNIEKALTNFKIEMGKDKKNHLTFELSEDIGDVSNSVKNRLALIFNNAAKKVGYEDSKLLQIAPKDTEEFKTRIIEILTKRINNSEVSFWVASEITANFDQYGMTKNFFNYAVVKGFLGEVYWNACFRYLTGGKTYATGTVKDESGRSITIDMIFRNAGFQIKAYNLHNFKAEFGTHGEKRGAGTFTIERAQITDAVGEALLYFFATASFNQPVSWASEEYRSMYESEWQSGQQQANEIFDAYADRIIGLDKTFEAELEDSNFFNGYGLYFNTFFLINQYIVPGSSIIQAIIDSINKTIIGDSQMLFKGSYSIEAKEKWSEKHPEPTKNLIQLADQVKLIYSITLDLSQLLNNAYSYLT